MAPDLSQYSTEELLAAYEGAKPAAVAPDLSGFSTEELLAAYNANQSPRTWGETFSDIGKGLAKSSVGVQGLFGPLLGPSFQVQKTVQDALGDPQYRGAGKAERIISQGISTLPYAAMGGGMLSAIGTGAGGEIAKELGAPEWLGEIIGGVGGGAIQNLGGKFAKGAGQKATALENRALGFTKADLAMSARREGLDAFDYVKQADGSIKKIPISNPSTQLENALEITKADGLLKGGTDPISVFKTAARRQDELGAQIREVLSKADEAFAGKNILPKFEIAENYIKTKASKVDKSKLEKILNTFKGALEGEIVTPSVLQNEKILLANKAYAAGSEYVKPFDEALAADLRVAIEGLADAATGQQGLLGRLNALHGSYQAIGNKLRVEAAKGGLPDPTGFFSNLSRTTDGVMGGAIAGSIVGQTSGVPGVGTVIGLGTSAASKGLQSSGARRLTAGIFRKIESADKKIPSSGIFSLGRQKSLWLSGVPAMGEATERLQNQQESRQRSQTQSPQASSSAKNIGRQLEPTPTQKEAVPSPQHAQNPASNQASFNRTSSNGYRPNPLFAVRKGMEDGRPNIQMVEAEIDKDPYFSALYEAESSRNPTAKNPESSATGGFQFIRATAKSLGLEDPTDLAASFDAVKKLTAEIDAVADGDPRMRYAGHYLGVPLLRKYLAGSKLTDAEQAQVSYLKSKALPRFMRIYMRIAQQRAGVTEA